MAEDKESRKAKTHYLQSEINSDHPNHGTITYTSSIYLKWHAGSVGSRVEPESKMQSSKRKLSLISAYKKDYRRMGTRGITPSFQKIHLHLS